MIRLNRDKLLTIKKMIRENKLKARVGIMGSGSARGAKNLKQAYKILEKGETLTNAQIGLWHEFGTTRMPMRSFLRMPLNYKFHDYLKKSRGIKTTVLQRCYEERSLEFLFWRIGVIARTVILDAFSSGGFGRWAPLSAYTLSRKKVNQILVETQDLRNSITHTVVK